MGTHGGAYHDPWKFRLVEPDGVMRITLPGLEIIYPASVILFIMIDNIFLDYYAST
jgi:hypothetical protein